MTVSRSVVVHRPQPVARPARAKRGRPERDGQFHVLGQGHKRERGRGAERVPEAPRPADHHQGQTAGDAQSGVRGHAETYTPHPRAAGSGDRPQHAGHSGKTEPWGDMCTNQGKFSDNTNVTQWWGKGYQQQ